MRDLPQALRDGSMLFEFRALKKSENNYNTSSLERLSIVRTFSLSERDQLVKGCI